MTQLFPRKTRHPVEQIRVIHVAIHQTQGRGSCFFLTVSMVNQHQVLIGQGVFNPSLWRFAGQEIVNLVEGIGHGLQQVGFSGTAVYRNKPQYPTTVQLNFIRGFL